MAPQMTLTMQEGLTSNLMDHLMKGSLDAAVVALPVNGNGIMARDLYEESFVVAMPKGHAWANRGSIDQAELQGERVLLMAHGHCMREDVLAACPGVVAGRDATSRNRAALTAEGTTLETLRYMVESDMGIAILPKSYALRFSNDDALAIVPLSKTASCRRIGIVWRSSFNRPQAIEALVSAIAHSQLKGVEMLAAIQASNLH
jgi:LysR family hydrogen peroxide-inducible transcriptional activator